MVWQWTYNDVTKDNHSIKVKSTEVLTWIHAVGLQVFYINTSYPLSSSCVDENEIGQNGSKYKSIKYYKMDQGFFFEHYVTSIQGINSPPL